MRKQIIYATVILYAFFGGYQVCEIIKNETKKIHKQLSQPLVIRAIASEVESGDRDNQAGDKRDGERLSDCHGWAEFWGEGYGVDVDLLKAIITSESENDYKKKNPASSASSCAQFLYGTWYEQGKLLWGDEFYEKNIWNPEDNVQLMVWIIKEKGTGPWNASRHKWENK